MATPMAWMDLLQNAQKTCLVQDGRRKLHFTLQDGRELAEEYDLNTNELVVRKWRKKSTLGGTAKWEYEVGELLAPRSLDTDGLMESTSNPIFVRKDTVPAFQWRIRNLPYPLETYSITCDEDQNIIIRTSNKKYYKKFRIPDLERCNIPLDQKCLSFAHANNTLIVSYKKPVQILDMEKALLVEFKKLKASKDGDVDCTPS
ncbi:DPCD-like protein [Mya arenaria]|uniref:Protein DPCD n=1 Tax=Mya arenaria TaxID=6604 RepID=A0ABY7FID5_MYAAR|nr:protein DPCD-like [Mya arenaria]WAR21965.1 DPCD-like protein [Mya arenaria]